MSLKNNLEEKIRGLTLNGVDIIFISDEYVFHRMRSMRWMPMDKPVQIIFAPDLNDIKALNEDDMKKLGWIKASVTPEG